MSTPVSYAGTKAILGVGNGVVSNNVDPYPRPSKVTIEGKKFMMNGQEWKPSGFQGEQPGTANDEATRWIDGGKANRDDIVTLHRFRRHLGGNCVRTWAHMWAVMRGDSYAQLEVNPVGMDLLMFQIEEAAKLGMSTYLTLNTHFHGAGSVGMPAWYQNHDASDETERWATQQAHCEAVVSEVVKRGFQDYVFAYDLINEPFNRASAADYFGPEAFEPGTGLYYNASLSIRSDADSDDTLAWATQIAGAIRTIDPYALITGGHLTTKSANGTPQTGGSFALDLMDDLFDFHSPHISPVLDAVDEAVTGTLNWVNGTSKPVMIAENHAINNFGNKEQNADFIQRVADDLQGIIGFLPYALIEDLEDPENYPDGSVMPPEIASGTLEEQVKWALQWAAALAISENISRIKMGDTV